jgi:hypothetical protein
VCAGEVLSRARIGWREERLRLRIFPRFAKLGSRPLSLPSKHKLPRRGSATIHVDQRERDGCIREKGRGVVLVSKRKE